MGERRKAKEHLGGCSNEKVFPTHCGIRSLSSMLEKRETASKEKEKRKEKRHLKRGVQRENETVNRQKRNALDRCLKVKTVCYWAKRVSLRSWQEVRGERQSDWLRRERGCFRAARSLKDVSEEWTKRQSSTERGLAALRLLEVWRRQPERVKRGRQASQRAQSWRS